MNATDLAQYIEAEERFGVHLMDYAGEWVARRGQHVINHAATLDDLLERIEGHEQDSDLTILRVPEHPEAVCFF